MLLNWMEHGTDIQRRHAEWRLAQPDILPDAPDPIPLAESLDLLRLVNSCLYRSRDAACGCSGFRCALRTVNPVVNHLECLECVKYYDNS